MCDYEQLRSEKRYFGANSANYFSALRNGSEHSSKLYVCFLAYFDPLFEAPKGTRGRRGGGGYFCDVFVMGWNLFVENVFRWGFGERLLRLVSMNFRRFVTTEWSWRQWFMQSNAFCRKLIPLALVLTPIAKPKNHIERQDKLNPS